MADIPAKPVLLTGASGALGRVLTRNLAAQGWTLRITDIAPFPDSLPERATFEKADLADKEAVLALAKGCGAILHFGGVSVERPFEEILGPNIRGIYHIYEAARIEKARVIFASSNHTMGFHERATTLDHDAPFRPDGFYGLSKAYGELMGRLYWDRHAVESVAVRIGSSVPEPKDARMLASYFSYDDLTSLMERAVLAQQTGCIVVWGASKNTRMTWWRKDARAKIGWEPKDDAESFAAQLEGKTTGNPISERYQGGAYTTMDYTRTEPSPAKLFE